MTKAVPIKNAECGLEELLKKLSVGETVTLTGDEGIPVALLVSLKSSEIERKDFSDWEVRMDELARKVSQAWKDERSAVEILSEMRR